MNIAKSSIGEGLQRTFVAMADSDQCQSHSQREIGWLAFMLGLYDDENGRNQHQTQQPIFQSQSQRQGHFASPLLAPLQARRVKHQTALRETVDVGGLLMLSFCNSNAHQELA